MSTIKGLSKEEIIKGITNDISNEYKSMVEYLNDDFHITDTYPLLISLSKALETKDCDEFLDTVAFWWGNYDIEIIDKNSLVISFGSQLKYTEPDYHYMITFYTKFIDGDYCDCDVNDPDYRVDKDCCGHGCRWQAPSILIQKVEDYLEYTWEGDEHSYWDSEEDFYKELEEISYEEAKQLKISEITRLQNLKDNLNERIISLKRDLESTNNNELM